MIGDQADVLQRLQSLLPWGWFSTVTAPIRDAILNGFAAVLSYIYSIIQFAKLQTRRLTSTGGFIDLSARDLFGIDGLPRYPGENDATYNARITASLFPRSNTKAAIAAALQQLTGYPARVMESFCPGDCGVFDGVVVAQSSVSGQPPFVYGAMFFDVDTAVTPARYGDAGRTGQFFVETPLPSGASIGGGFAAAFDVIASFDVWDGWWVDLLQTGLTGPGAVYNLINRLRVVGTIAWVKFVHPVIVPTPVYIGSSPFLETEAGVPLLAEGLGTKSPV